MRLDFGAILKKSGKNKESKSLALLLLLALSGCNGIDRLIYGHSDPKIPPAPAPLWIGIDGQSNGAMGGYPNYSMTGHVWINKEYYDDLTMFQPTKEHPVMHSAPWVMMADEIYRRTGRDVYLVNVCKGAQSAHMLATTYSGPLFEACRRYPISLICWTQGEADPLTTAQEYYDTMKDLITRIRQMGCKAKWGIALDGWIPGGQGDPRGGQLKLIADGWAFQGADVDAIRDLGGPLTNDGKLHIAVPGYPEFARRWLEPVLKVLDK